MIQQTSWSLWFIIYSSRHNPGCACGTPLFPNKKNLYISEIYAHNCPLKNLDGYFSSLENAAHYREGHLGCAGGRINATLAAASNASLTAALADLQKRLSKPWEDPQPPHRETTRQRHDRPDCKKEVYRAANDCCELKNNAHLRHPGLAKQVFFMAWVQYNNRYK